jgi:FKBP-type peptidyl-prolyl cis-trans isomerase
VYFQITVHIKGSLAENGAVFWDSRSTNSPLTYTVNEGQIMPALDRASLGLQVGEIRRVSIPAADAYGDTGNVGWGIPPNKDLIFEVEVLNMARS